MTEAAEIEKEDYGKIEEGQSSSQFTVAQNDLLVKPSCETGDCTCKVEEPAEAAWVKLMSAVPQASQINNLRAAREGTMMLPEGQTIQSMVKSIRPQPEADYAIDTIRDAWTDFFEEFRIVGPKLEQGLATLSSAWKGDDFDAFEEQAETVIKNCKTIQNDIGGESGADGVIKVLDTKQSEIFEQQGGTACVYPAPKFFMEGTSCGSHRIHIRPPFFRNCEIRANDETKAALELAGFDPQIVDEVSEGRQQTYDMWNEYVTANPDYEEGGLKGKALAESKAEEYATRRLDTLGTQGSSQLEEEAARVNEEVTERHSNVEAQVTDIAPDSKPGEQTTFNDGPDTDFPGPGGLDTGGGGGMPDLDQSGLNNMSGPTDLSKLSDTPGGLNGTGNSPGGLDTTGGLNGTGNAPGDYSGGNGLNGLDDENPFGAGQDPDNLGGAYGSGGTPPGGINGGSDLSPYNSPEAPDLDDVSGGLAGGGGAGGLSGPPPGGLGGGGGGLSGGGLGGGLGGGGTNLVPTNLRPPTGVGGGGLKPGSTTGKGLGGKTPGYTSIRNAGPGGTKPGGLGGGRGLSGTGAGGAKPGGLGGSGSGLRGGGSVPGGSGSGSGLRGGGVGGAGGGSGLGRGAGGMGAAGAGAAGGRGAGAAGAHGGMMGGAPGGRGPGDDQDHEKKYWLVEEEDTWGGGPEDEDDDPFA
ncbi:hypothetical protein SAMN05216298_1819 [Glycomyces sambucus]|uniref:Uncharacterized protein n=1 Tax=Glycomyces sambucus TaxID=380244 RepID=A0A1G9FIM3_9ACTN|nr:hypothetical protein [Glycomyces sambucus]SDK88234.1 hypothetical protein SAMN05216298_1819 [Glycomyces sambucus]